MLKYFFVLFCYSSKITNLNINKYNDDKPYKVGNMINIEFKGNWKSAKDN